METSYPSTFVPEYIDLPRADRLEMVAYDVGSILMRHGVPFRVWSGSQAAALGNHRESQDVDLWLPDSAIFPAYEHLSRYARFPVALKDLSDRTIVAVGEDEEVELMANMDIHIEDAVYPLRFTKQVLTQSTPPRHYGRNMMPMAPPEDTMLLKAILQRDESVGKYDGPDIRAMVGKMRWINEPYLLRRMSACNAADRALPFLRENGVLLSSVRDVES